MRPEPFLKAVVRDHVFLMDQMSGSWEPDDQATQ